MKPQSTREFARSRIFAPGDRLVEVADNLVRFYMRDASIVADSSENGLLNNDVLWPSTSLQVGGGSTIEIDLRRGSCFIATVTNTVQVTVTDPRFGISGQKIVVTVENLGGIPGSGVTFGSSYLMEGDLELPAVGKRRSISFVYDGTFWVETGRTGDVG